MKNTFYKLFIFCVLFLLIQEGCQPDSPDFSQNETKTTEGTPKINFFTSETTDFVLFKKEGIMEIWGLKEGQKAKLASFSAKVHPGVMVGGFRIKPDSVNINLDYPGDFYKNKARTYHQTLADSLFFSTIKYDRHHILIDENAKLQIQHFLTVTNLHKKMLFIFPNDSRNGDIFAPCSRCPHWMQEVYGQLSLRIQDYQ